MPFALVLGVLARVFEFIPLIGSLAIAVILAVLCGAEIAGIAGIFLSVPVAGIIAVIVRQFGGTEEIVADILEPAPAPAAPIVVPDAGVNPAAPAGEQP